MKVAPSSMLAILLAGSAVLGTGSTLALAQNGLTSALTGQVSKYGGKDVGNAFAAVLK